MLPWPSLLFQSILWYLLKHLIFYFTTLTKQTWQPSRGFPFKQRVCSVWLITLITLAFLNHSPETRCIWRPYEAYLFSPTNNRSCWRAILHRQQIQEPLRLMLVSCLILSFESWWCLSFPNHQKTWNQKADTLTAYTSSVHIRGIPKCTSILQSFFLSRLSKALLKSTNFTKRGLPKQYIAQNSCLMVLFLSLTQLSHSYFSQRRTAFFPSTLFHEFTWNWQQSDTPVLIPLAPFLRLCRPS